jgi:hypothetical protein
MVLSVHNGKVDLQLTFLPDIAWFYLNGCMNTQNNKHWSTENKHEVPLHDVKVGVWCIQSLKRIIGPVLGRKN